MEYLMEAGSVYGTVEFYTQKQLQISHAKEWTINDSFTNNMTLNI